MCSQRVVDRAELSDFEICNQYNIDNTGLVCKFSFVLCAIWDCILGVID